MNRRWGSDRRASDSATAFRNVPYCPDVAEQLRELDCDPIAGMAMLAQDDSVPVALRARMFAELANYTTPRRKAVELSGPSGQPLEPQPAFEMSLLTLEERETLTKLLNKARIGRGS